jgi:hypothetical protein
LPEGENTIELDTLSDSDFDVDDKVVLLYLESFEKKGDLCTSIDCDNQGIEQVARLRVLLVSEDDAEYIAGQDPIFTWHNIVQKYTELPEIKVPRVDLTTAYDLNSIKQCYVKAISSTILQKMKEGYETIFEIFNKTLISDKIDQLFNFITPAIPIPQDFQYRYDLLADLIDTYNEIKEILLHINVECNPDINSFPKHLMLGKVKESEEFKTLRHRFYKTPISKTENFNRQKVVSLLKRAEELVNKYNTGSKKVNIRITPSQKSGMLGYKAIPNYYNIDNDYLEYWCFEKSLNLKQKYNLSYNVELLSDETEVQEPLLFNIDKYDFLNIEGLQTSALESRDAINSLKILYGLNFDCIVIELQSDLVTFKDFVKNNPSLNHKLGVPKDGTFIIVANNDITVADFYLPYKIPVKVEEQNCCYLMECTYPWISSLKYLNNLARSLKGTQSRSKAMPQNYILQVFEYKINGQSLINNTSVISIPLNEIYLRRMHAVAEALNNRFNKGVIFDFNESQKRFVIIRAREDTYTIRFRDVTMTNNSPIYTYSNNGMFRDDKVFRPDAMRCRSLKEYNPAYYEKLHSKIAPVNKDDDYGTFNEKWRKWNELKERLANNNDSQQPRMITNVNQLPEEISNDLNGLKAAFWGIVNESQIASGDVIFKVAAELIFKLDGDWVTGDWVNKEMLDHYYYGNNRNNTHDDIVLFIKLRKFLHSETGVTKLSVYFTNHKYDKKFDIVIEKYNYFADIYFGEPKGINAIRV